MLGDKQFYYTSNNYIAVNIVVTRRACFPTAIDSLAIPMRVILAFMEMLDNFKHQRAIFRNFDRWNSPILSIPPIYTLGKYYYPTAKEIDPSFVYQRFDNPKFPCIRGNPPCIFPPTSRLIYRQLGAANCPCIYIYMYIHFNKPSLEQVGVGCSRF